MHDQPLLIVFDELGEESRIVLSKLLNLTGNNVLPGARLPYMKILLQDTIPSAFIAPMVVPPRLARGTGLERRVAIAIAVSGWLTMALARLGAQAFMIGMLN